MTEQQEVTVGCSPTFCPKLLIIVFLIILFFLLGSDLYITALVVATVGGAAVLLLYAVSATIKRKNIPNDSTGPDTEDLYTISATPRLSFLQANQPRPPQRHGQPSPQQTNTSLMAHTSRPPSYSTSSLSSQLSHAYYTHSSNFSSLSPYIASVSVEGRHHTAASPAPRSASTTASDAAWEAVRQTVNQSLPTYVEAVDDDMGQPSPPPQFHTTSAASGHYGEVFGPSSDGLPSYETVVATRQLPSDAPPPYSPS